MARNVVRVKISVNYEDVIEIPAEDLEYSSIEEIIDNNITDFIDVTDYIEWQVE
tara:strand:- start:1323 stop:1484 length:162 start_codon:yes stop_codon:yes gene_type:complete